MGSNYELWSTSSQRTDSGNIHRLLTAESKQNSICDDTARTGLQRFVKNCVPMHNTHKRGSSPPVSEPINWVYSLAYIYIYIYLLRYRHNIDLLPASHPFFPIQTSHEHGKRSSTPAVHVTNLILRGFPFLRLVEVVRTSHSTKRHDQTCWHDLPRRHEAFSHSQRENTAGGSAQ